MMATWRQGESAGEPGRGMEVSWETGWCMSMVVSPPRVLLRQLLCIAKYGRKKILRSAFARGADERLHVIKVALEGAPAGRRQAVLGLRQAAIERFRAMDILGFFELARVHAKVAVGGLEQGFQLVEGERAIDGESADNAEADALVDEAVRGSPERFAGTGRKLRELRFALAPIGAG